MIGIDIVSIGRIQKFIQKFGCVALERFLSQEEILLCLKIDSNQACEIQEFKALEERWRNDPLLLNSFINVSRVAGFWAAKEACSKALGVGVGGQLGFLDMRIDKNIRNAPQLSLPHDKMNQFGVSRIALSISHDEGFAIAAVMLKEL